LKELQRLYRVRLDHAIAAHRELMDLAGQGGLVAGERRSALEALRALDRHHLEQVRAVHDEFEARWQPSRREAVARQRQELAAELAAAAVVVIAGGHVAVLLNRLRLFDLRPLLTGKTIVAWSAGAMVAARWIVLFHDSPPWGAGNAEVLDVGLDLCGDILPLPDVRRRLRMDDPRRVELLARRFAPLECVGLDETSRLSRGADGWRGRGAHRFGWAGDVKVVGRSGWEDLSS
ncbi:MAG: Type 1 glutamine amidotransferase-like domain-containing protein, partial [Acidobacteria bacterium]|nr:Type 1 glutamine amidotransferase-like domain-containing protein [Acidobacteriota bacterium]